MPLYSRDMRRRARLLPVGLAFSLGLAGASAWAQSGSAPVGVVSYAAEENSTISIGVPLLRPSVAMGVVTAVSGSTLTLAGAGGEPAAAIALGSGESYYIEVIGHTDGVTKTLVGQRFELDETATLSGAAGTVVLDPAGAYNTSAASAIGGLVNYRVAVRPHWTLASLFGTGVNAKVNAGTSVATADQVLAWSGTGFSVYYLRSGETPQWRNIATGPASQDGAILPPGTGIYLRRRTGALAFSVSGEVRINQFARAPFEGSQLVAAGFPVDSSPTDWKLVTGTGLTPGTSPLNADQLLKWTGTGFSQYYLRSSAAPEWRNTATGLLNYSSATIFPANGATLILLRGPALGTPPPPLAQGVPFSL